MSHTVFLTIDCVKCSTLIDDVLMDDFDDEQWAADGWEFGLFSQPNNGLIIESPRSAYIAGICPECPK